MTEILIIRMPNGRNVIGLVPRGTKPDSAVVKRIVRNQKKKVKHGH